MYKEKFDDNPRTHYESLYDLNLLGLWSQYGSDWSSTIKEEIQADTIQSLEQEKPQPTKKIVLFGVLATLALLGASAWIPASEVVQVVSGGDKRPKPRQITGLKDSLQAGKIPSLLTTYFFGRKINPHSVARLW
jgi:hypothetical protein